MLKETNVSIESGLRFVVCIVRWIPAKRLSSFVTVSTEKRNGIIMVSCLAKTVGNLKNVGILVLIIINVSNNFLFCMLPLSSFEIFGKIRRCQYVGANSVCNFIVRP